MNYRQFRDLIENLQWKNNITIYNIELHDDIPIMGKKTTFNPSEFVSLTLKGQEEEYLTLFTKSKFSTNLENNLLYLRESSENEKGISLFKNYIKLWEYIDDLWIILSVFENKYIWDVYYKTNHPKASILQAIIDGRSIQKIKDYTTIKDCRDTLSSFLNDNYLLNINEIEKLSDVLDNLFNIYYRYN